MTNRRSIWKGIARLPLLAALSGKVKAATPSPSASPTGAPGMEMLTIFLRHDENQTVDQINQHLKATGWFDNFPPAGVEVGRGT